MRSTSVFFQMNCTFFLSALCSKKSLASKAYPIWGSYCLSSFIKSLFGYLPEKWDPPFPPLRNRFLSHFNTTLPSPEITPMYQITHLLLGGAGIRSRIAEGSRMGTLIWNYECQNLWGNATRYLPGLFNLISTGHSYLTDLTPHGRPLLQNRRGSPLNPPLNI